MAVQKENKKGRDNIQSKIERLKAFAKQYPYAFSNMAELKKRLEEEGKTEEKAELEALYESEYTYLRARNLQGKLSEALIKEIREGRIGGVFPLSKEDTIYQKEIGISEAEIEGIVQNFGSVAHFQEAYIQYRVDLANAADSMEEEKIVQTNPIMLKYQKQLPLIRDFYFGESKAYETMLEELIGRYNDQDSKSWVLDKGIDSALDILLQRFPNRTREILGRQLGLNNEKKETLREVGKKMNLSPERVRQLKNKAISHGKRFLRVEIKERLAFEANEEFIRAYFEQYGIWKQDGKVAIREEDRERLIALCSGKEKQQSVHIQSVPDSIRMLEENTERLISPLHSAGIKTMTDLLKLTPIQLQQIQYIGPKKAQEIMDLVHQKGYQFEWEEAEKEGIQNPKLIAIETLALSKKTYRALIKKKIGDISSLLQETPESLLKIQQIDPKSVQEIMDAVHQRGFQFEWEKEKEGTKQEERSPEMMRIEELPLRRSVYIPLIRANIQKISELLTLTPEGLKRIRQIGPKAAQEIMDAVHQKGFQFQYEEEKEFQEPQEEQENEGDKILQNSSGIPEENKLTPNQQPDDLKRKVDVLKAEKEEISQEVNKLVEQLDQGERVDSAIRSAIIQTYQLLQEQTKVMQEISLAIWDTQTVEKEKQEERANLQKNLKERTREGE